MQGSSFGSKSI